MTGGYRQVRLCIRHTNACRTHDTGSSANAGPREDTTAHFTLGFTPRSVSRVARAGAARRYIKHFYVGAF